MWSAAVYYSHSNLKRDVMLFRLARPLAGCGPQCHLSFLLVPLGLLTVFGSIHRLSLGAFRGVVPRLHVTGVLRGVGAVFRASLSPASLSATMSSGSTASLATALARCSPPGRRSGGGSVSGGRSAAGRGNTQRERSKEAFLYLFVGLYGGR